MGNGKIFYEEKYCWGNGDADESSFNMFNYRIFIYFVMDHAS